MTQTPQLSVVVPVFNEQDNVAPLVQEIVTA
ncbi:dolichol-phosphate mannosyltransferase, partial [Lysobacter sp. 2RAB21]